METTQINTETPIQPMSFEEQANKGIEILGEAIEEARNNKVIGKSLSAKLVIKPNDETKQLLESIKSDLKTIFIVSELVITDEEIEGLKFDSATIQVTAKQGTICKRCWQVVDDVNEDGICDRCAKVVEKL